MRQFLLAVKGSVYCVEAPRELLLMGHPKNTRFRLQQSSGKWGLHKERHYKKRFAKSV